MNKIKLTQNEWAIVDKDMYPFLSKFRWCTYGKGVKYAARSFDADKKMTMHHVVVGYPLKKGFVVDHINRNPLDNRRENLRIVPHSVNMRNTKRNFKKYESFLKSLNNEKKK